MVRKLVGYFFLLLLYQPIIIFCQRTYSETDSATIFRLLDLADEQDLAGKIDEALNTTENALRLSETKKMARGEGFALLKIADLTYKKSGKELDPNLFEKPRLIGLALKDSFLTGLSYHQQGQYYTYTGQHVKAVPLLENATSFYQAKNLLNYRGLVLNELGFVCDRIGEREQAIKWYLQAVRIFEELGNEKEYANSLGNIAVVNYRLGKREEAITIFKQCLQIRKKLGDTKGITTTYGNLIVAFTPISLDSALHYQEEAIPYVKATGTLAAQAQSHGSKAVLLSRLKRWKEAIPEHEKAIELYQQAGDDLKMANQYVILADTYAQGGAFEEAIAFYNKAETIGREKNYKQLLLSVYSAKSKFYERIKDYLAAYEAQTKYQLYKDSLWKEQDMANINELQIKYETEKKDNEIIRLESEKRIRQLEIEKQRAINEGNLLEAKRKEADIALLKKEQALKEQELAIQRDALEKQELLAKTNEQQLMLSRQELSIAEKENELKVKELEKERFFRNALIGGTLLIVLLSTLTINRVQLRKKIEEQKHLLEIRNKISRDLHDEIGSTLTSIQILSNVSEQMVVRDPEQAQKMIGNIALQSKQVQQNMSDIVWAIRPDNDKIENLTARMREYVGSTFEPKEIETVFEVDEDILNYSLPMEARKETLLIFKEAMNNVLKHANATRVQVTISKREGNLEMAIADNGQWKQKKDSSGTGSRSMKDRAAAIGGHLGIAGTDHGTTVKLSIPIP